MMQRLNFVTSKSSAQRTNSNEHLNEEFIEIIRRCRDASNIATKLKIFEYYIKRCNFPGSLMAALPKFKDDALLSLKSTIKSLESTIQSHSPTCSPSRYFILPYFLAPNEFIDQYQGIEFARDTIHSLSLANGIHNQVSVVLDLRRKLEMNANTSELYACVNSILLGAIEIIEKLYLKEEGNRNDNIKVSYK